MYQLHWLQRLHRILRQRMQFQLQRRLPQRLRRPLHWLLGSESLNLFAESECAARSRVSPLPRRVKWV